MSKHTRLHLKTLSLVFGSAMFGSAAVALTFEEYAKIVGEVSIAAIGCGRQIDQAEFIKVGKKFAKTDPKELEKANLAVGVEFQNADKRFNEIGKDAFCAAAIANYGPQGAKQKGLLK
ncbi:MAG: hypothetical protein ACKVP7_09265 [Hyphomicrobiaceae bacterium]